MSRPGGGSGAHGGGGGGGVRGGSGVAGRGGDQGSGQSRPARPIDGPNGAKALTGIAFFDFDNTLIHGDAGPLFGRHLYQRHLFGTGRLRRWARYVPFVAWMGAQAALYQVRARRRSSIVRSAYKGLRGVPAAAFYGEMEHFVDEEVVPRIYPRMLQEIRGHQDAGRRCVVVTTGMEELVARALAHFPPGMDLIGCRLEERRGRLTGGVTGPLYGVDKANIIHAYCRASNVDPADCWAYSDHGSDREMLEAVGHGVAVNPRGAFAKAAQRQDWRVLVLPDPMEDDPSA